MKTHFRGALVLAAASGLLLTGCSAGTPTPAATDGEPTGTLTVIWAADYETALTPTVEAFEEQYPDVDLQVEYSGGDILGTVSTQIQAGTVADVMPTLPGGTAGAGGGVSTRTLASQGLLLDLSDSTWSGDIPELWASDVTYEDAVYAYPGALQGIGPIWDTAALAEMGAEIPRTWDDLLQLCADAQDEGKYALAQGIAENVNWVYLAQTSQLVYGPDAEWDQKQLDGDVTFQDSDWVEAFDQLKEMNDEGCFGEGAVGGSTAQALEAVANGSALGTTAVGAGISGITAQNPDGEYAIAPMPSTDAADDRYMPALPGFTISVYAKAKNPVAAKAFLEVLNENIGSYAEGFSSVPVIADPSFTPDPALEEFNTAVAEGKFTKLPNSPTPEVQTVLMEGAQAVMLGSQTSVEALTKAQEAYDAGRATTK